MLIRNTCVKFFHTSYCSCSSTHSFFTHFKHASEGSNTQYTWYYEHYLSEIFLCSGEKKLLKNFEILYFFAVFFIFGLPKAVLLNQEDLFITNRRSCSTYVLAKKKICLSKKIKKFYKYSSFWDFSERVRH